MVIFPVIRWSGCDLCLGYDENRKRLTVRRFRLFCGMDREIKGYYQFFLWGPIWIFLIRDGRYFFVNRKTRQEIWLGDEGIAFQEKRGRLFSEYVVTYKDQWRLHSYAFTKLDVSRLDPTWDQLDQTTENIVSWVIDIQAAQRRTE